MDACSKLGVELAGLTYGKLGLFDLVKQPELDAATTQHARISHLPVSGFLMQTSVIRENVELISLILQL